MAMYLRPNKGIVYNLGLGICWAKYVFAVVTHVLGVLEF